MNDNARIATRYIAIKTLAVLTCLAAPCSGSPQQNFKRAVEAKDGETKWYYADQLVREAPSAWQGYALRAEANRMLKKLKEAEQDADEAIRRADKESPPYSTRSLIRLLQDDFAGCIADADKAIQFGDTRPQIYGIRGQAYYLKNEYRTAKQDLDQALEIDPDYVPALLVRSKVNRALKQPDKAIGDLDHVLGLQPDSLSAVTRRMDLLISLRRFSEAARDCETWQRLDAESDKPAKARREILAMQAAENEDIDSLRDIADEDKENVGLQMRLALLSIKSEKWTDVVAAANRILSLASDPQTTATAYRFRGTAYRMTGALHDALDDFDKALECDPGNLSTQTERGAVFTQLKQYHAAIEQLDAVLARKDCPDPFFAGLCRTKAHIALEEWDAAYRDARILVTAANTDKRKASAYFQLGIAAWYKRLVSQSTEANTKAFELDPAMADAVFNRACCHWRSSRILAAFEDCERGLQIDPESVFGRYARASFYSLVSEDPAFCLTRLSESPDALQEKARRDLEKAVEADKDCRWKAWCYARLAEMARNRDRYAEAIQAASSAIAVEPKKAHAMAYVVRAASHRALGEYEKAIEDCTSAIEQKDHDHRANAYAERAAAHRARGEYDLAVSDADEAVCLQPRQNLARHERAYARLAKYRGVAVDPARSAAKLSAILLDPTGQMQLPTPSIAKSTAPQPDQQRRVGQEAAGGRWPYLPEAIESRTDNEERKHPLAPAVADFRILINANYNRASSICGLARCLNAMGRCEEAQQVCDGELTKPDAPAELYVIRAMARFVLSQIEQGMQDAQAAVEKNEKDADARLAVAYGYALSNRWDECRSECETAIRQRPPSIIASQLLLLWYAADVQVSVSANTLNRIPTIMAKLGLQEDDWSSAILGALVQEKQIADLAGRLPDAMDADVQQQRLCQAYYYYAIRDLSQGRIVSAKQVFQKVLKAGSEHQVEFLLAHHALQRLGV